MTLVEKESKGNLWGDAYTLRTHCSMEFDLYHSRAFYFITFNAGPLLSVCRQRSSVFSTTAVLVLFGASRHQYTRNQVAADL